MPIRKTIDGGRVPVRIWTDEVESSAYDQLKLLGQLPIVHGHVAAMPDVHMGIGTTVGAVIPTRRAIIPAAVGVDIGCGMNAVRLSLGAAQLPDSLGTVRAAIESAVPVGFDAHASPIAPREVLRALAPRFNDLLNRHPDLGKLQKNADRTWTLQLGSLGGGNHFIELCLDEADRVWIMLHSGSRGIGNAIGRYFIELARRDMERHQQRLPHRDLAYFEEGARHFDDYVDAVHWAQDYALHNRRAMMKLIVDAMRPHLPPFEFSDEAINCHHNYVAIEQHGGERLYITRKGAIRAGAGELGIVPGSMGARSYIVRGKGSAESWCSSAHGAGRRMSRSEARRRFKARDLVEQTQGVECRKDSHVVDEIPSAYKDIDTVMANQSDLVDVVHTLKQVVCVKG
jgi:tRNA-splicing ligase RtcB